MWETFEHTADIGIRGVGRTVKEAFSEAAVAMFSQMADLKEFGRTLEIKGHVESSNVEELFLEFLNRLLYESSVHSAIFTHVNITDMKDTELTFVAHGEKIRSTHRNSLLQEVKAATFHMLKVERSGLKHLAQCILDI